MYFLDADRFGRAEILAVGIVVGPQVGFRKRKVVLHLNLHQTVQQQSGVGVESPVAKALLLVPLAFASREAEEIGMEELLLGHGDDLRTIFHSRVKALFSQPCQEVGRCNNASVGKRKKGLPRLFLGQLALAFLDALDQRLHPFRMELDTVRSAEEFDLLFCAAPPLLHVK